MCRYCQNPIIDRDGGFWMEYEKIPGVDHGAYKSTGATITTSGPDVYLETRGLPDEMCIEINYCPICGRKVSLDE